jgi:hypothetical protein
MIIEADSHKMLAVYSQVKKEEGFERGDWTNLGLSFVKQQKRRDTVFSTYLIINKSKFIHLMLKYNIEVEVMD